MDTNVFDPKIEMVIQTLVHIDPEAWIEDEKKETINVTLPIPKNVKKFLEIIFEGDEKLLGRSPENFKSTLFLVLVLRGITCSIMGIKAAEDLIKGIFSGTSEPLGNFQSAFSTLDKINIDELKKKDIT